jgi:hypothetical protein
MCRWLSYSGAPIFLEKLLFEPEFSLIAQSLHARKAAVATNGDGFGVGWYGERPVPGLYRDILPAWADPNLKSLAHQIRTRMYGSGPQTLPAGLRPATFRYSDRRAIPRSPRRGASCRGC